jgi:hypothetical protein
MHLRESVWLEESLADVAALVEEFNVRDREDVPGAMGQTETRDE